MNFKEELASHLTFSGLSPEETVLTLEVPKDKANGDLAFPCFKIAKIKKMPPAQIAMEAASALKIDFVQKIEAKGAYLNFFLDRSYFAKVVLEEIETKKENYGSSTQGAGKNVIIDFSSPNIAKPFHVGHLRSTVIGAALYRIYSLLGYNCIGINHLGDWGTQFGKLIVAYKLWSSEEEVKKGGVNTLTDIYVKFHEEASKNPDLEDQARAYMLKMQEGDEEALSIWQFFYDISMEEFNRIYKRLKVSFDYNTGESFYNDKMDAVVDELREKNLLQESEGAQLVDLEEYNMPPCLILRKDGGTLYHTRDLAAAFYRKKEFNFYKALYLTAIDQNLHFSQLFKVIEKMGYNWDMGHVPFGLVSLESGKISTRGGNVVLMEELLNEAESAAKSIIEKKNPNLENKDRVAAQVGIGAVIFNDLYNNRIKDVLFSFDKMLNFDGETGPFVQYAHARACSLLAKAPAINHTDVDYGALTDDAAFNLITSLYYYKESIQEAAAKNEPYILTRRLMDIAQTFNRFYSDNPVLTGCDNVRTARLVVVQSTRNVLKWGLQLLGIEVPEQM